MSGMELPEAFDPTALDAYAYLTPRLSEANRRAVMGVLRRLISGEGVTHKSKPGEAFCRGDCVTPLDDLEELQRAAAEWLPHRGPDALDKGHGWALHHPLQKLIQYQRHLLGVEPEPKRQRKGAGRKTALEAALQAKNEELEAAKKALEMKSVELRTSMEMLLQTGAELAAAKEALQAKGAEAVREAAKAESGLGA